MYRFLQTAFIRKNTPELRKKLEYLGYSHGKPEYYADDDDNKYDFVMCHNGRFFLLSQNNHVIRNGHPLKKHGSINCGTNEPLFLAIAALRDDIDKNQWFVYPNENIWFICDDYDINYVREYIRDSVQSAWFHCSHKATVEELIEHFKEWKHM